MALPLSPGSTIPPGPSPTATAPGRRPTSRGRLPWGGAIVAGVVTVLALSLAAGAGAMLMYRVDHPKWKTIIVPRMDIVREATRTGRVLPGVSEDVKSGVSGIVTDVLAAKGQMVAAGDVLFVLADPALDAQVAGMEADLEVARTKLDEMLVANAKGADEADLEAARLQIERAELTCAQRQAELDRLDVRSPIDGRVFEWKVAPGDAVATGQILGTVVDDSRMNVICQIDQAYANRVKVGDEAWVSASIRDFPTVKGKIIEIAKEIDSSKGWGALNVTVAIDPSPVLKPGMRGLVEIRGTDSIWAGGTFRYPDRRDILAPAAATVEGLAADAGEVVAKDATLVTLHSDSAELAVRQAENDLELARANQAKLIAQKGPYDQSAIDAQVARIEASESTLELRRADLEAMTVRAPISGVLSEIKVRPGDRVAAGMVLTTVSDDSSLRMVVPIEDSDLQAVSSGLKVSLYFANLPGRAVPATVTDVASAPVVRDGKGTFDVTLAFAPTEGVVPGMLGTAVIPVGTRVDVPAVPVVAIAERSGEQWVTILKDVDGRKKELNVMVLTGLSDGQFVEITCGLGGGEELVVPEDFELIPSTRALPGVGP